MICLMEVIHLHMTYEYVKLNLESSNYSTLIRIINTVHAHLLLYHSLL